jgi:hypothetical protein
MCGFQELYLYADDPSELKNAPSDAVPAHIQRRRGGDRTIRGDCGCRCASRRFRCVADVGNRIVVGVDGETRVSSSRSVGES